MATEVEIDEAYFNNLKILYRKETEDEKVIAHSFENDIFFKEIPSFRPAEKPVIIDIGAHIGTFSLYACSKFPQADVYAFEASYDTYKILEANKNNNSLSKLHVFHNAVSGKAGDISLYHNKETGNWGHSTTKKLSNSFESVEAYTLHDIIKANGIEHIDLIKFNCEGAEFNILTNTSSQIIQKIRTGIILYHEDLVDNKAKAEDLAYLFSSNGFRVINTRKSTSRGWLVVWNMKWYTWPYLIQKAIARRLRIIW